MYRPLMLTIYIRIKVKCETCGYDCMLGWLNLHSEIATYRQDGKITWKVGIDGK